MYNFHEIATVHAYMYLINLQEEEHILISRNKCMHEFINQEVVHKSC
jgi:hypothetical protein